MRSFVIVGFPFALACGSASGFPSEEKDAGASLADASLSGFPDAAIGFDACNKGRGCRGADVVACSPDGGLGEILETCGGDTVCVSGACVRGCAAAESRAWNIGCEFWAVHLDNTTNNVASNPAKEPWGVVLTNVGSTDAVVVIERNDAAPGQAPVPIVVRRLTVRAHSLETVELEPRPIDGSSAPGKNDGPGSFLSSQALRIRSSEPLVAHQMNSLRMSYSNDASLLLPKNALGDLYRTLAFAPSTVVAPFPPFQVEHSYATVVGTEANTRVTIRAGGQVLAGGPIPAMKKGDTASFTLGPFDVLNIESDGTPGDLSGTVVSADRSMAVFGGTEASIVPSSLINETNGVPKPPGWKSGDVCCSDHLEEQMLPVTSFGKSYAVARSPVRSPGAFTEADIIRVLGVAEDASVATTLPPPNDHFQLAPGEVRTFSTTSGFVLTASAPVAVGQLMVSQAYTDKGSGDPSFTVFPSTDQFRNDFLFLVPTSFRKNFVVVTLPKTSTLAIDGQSPLCDIRSVGQNQGIVFEARECPLPEGVHKLETSEPSSIVVYGIGIDSSYAFLGGANVGKIYRPPPIVR